MKRITTVLVLLALVSACVFAGGSGEASSAAAGSGEVSYKDQVVIGFQSKTSSVDPTSQTSVAHRIFFNLTHNTLVGYDEVSKALVPELAKSWTSSSDFKTWSFELRDDVYFHNGEKFSADDVLFTWEWAKENASNATVKNFYASTIRNVKVIDDTHVEIELASGNIDFLYTYSNEYFAVLNREAVTASAEGTAIGTGPYMNDEFVTGDHTTLQRFDRYWGELPTTKTLLFRYISDGSTRLAALEAGEIDVCQAPNNTELDIIRANRDLALTTYQATALTFLAFNLDDPVLQDENLRLAIAYAINDQEIIDGAASGQGGVAYGMWGYFQYGYFDDWASVGQSAYNPQNMDKAKEYLAKSNYPNGGVTIKFTAANQWTVNSLQIIQAQLKPLNINVEIEQVDAAGFGNKTKNRDFQVVIYSITFTAAGSDAARIYTKGNSVNYADYDNARVAELFSLAAAETNDSVRQGYYKEIQTIVHQECPYIPLYYANSGAAYTTKLSGAVFNSTGKYDYTYVKVEK